jgi:ABC-type nitrate/sulfonate/bicarbonate transport system substrate-binding protein
MKKLRLNAFPGAPNLPVFAAIANGYFSDEKLDIDLTLTPSSVVQAERTAAGDFDIIFTAFDNVVAYGENQGAAAPNVHPDYVVLMGATQLELAITSAADVKSYADLKGKAIALDALSTGFAFALFEMCDRNGFAKDEASYAPVGATPQRWNAVKAGEYAATLTIEPFTSIARRNGFNTLDLSSKYFPSYQGGVVTTTRKFAADHPEYVQAFIRAYLRGLDWVLNPENRTDAEDILRSKMPEIQPAALQSVMNSLLSPASGLTPHAEILPEGMLQVLALRSRYGTGGKPLTDYNKYIDLSHYHTVTGA